MTPNVRGGEEHIEMETGTKELSVMTARLKFMRNMGVPNVTSGAGHCKKTVRQDIIEFYNILAIRYIGAVTIPKTSSTTSSGPMSSSIAATASNLLPHCILLSFSGVVILILCR